MDTAVELSPSDEECVNWLVDTYFDGSEETLEFLLNPSDKRYKNDIQKLKAARFENERFDAKVQMLEADRQRLERLISGRKTFLTLDESSDRF